jgi:hypothetical protein
MFNATFNMFMLNGSVAHKHTITDFKMTGNPSTNGNTTTFNGTATVSLKACYKCANFYKADGR